MTVTATVDGERSTVATLSDGTTRDVDLLVVADGVASKTRAMLGINTTAAYSGQMVWRAIVPRPDWADRLFTWRRLEDESQK